MYEKTLVQIFNEFAIQNDEINLELFASHIPLMQLNEICSDIEDHASINEIAHLIFNKIEESRKETDKRLKIISLRPRNSIYDYSVLLQKELLKEWRNRIMGDIECCVHDKETKQYFKDFYGVR